MATDEKRVAWWARWALRASLPLYLLSLMLPAIEVGTREWHWGYYLAMIGWLGLATGHASWFANLFYFAAWVLVFRKQWQIALLLSVLGIMLAASFPLHDTIAMSTSGAQSPIRSVGSGYHVWLASMFALAVGAAGNLTAKPGSRA